MYYIVITIKTHKQVHSSSASMNDRSHFQGFIPLPHPGYHPELQARRQAVKRF